MNNPAEKSQDNNEIVGTLFGSEIQPVNLKEKFLFATIQIVAELGPEGLSASELIKRTDSSKGALFHHFKTLEDLCFNSLLFFSDLVKNMIKIPPCSSLNEFLSVFIEDAKKRQYRREYFHLTHFFREKAMKDKRFQTLLSENQDILVTACAHYLASHIPHGADFKKVKSIAAFLVGALERIFYQAIFLGNPQIIEDQVPLIIQSVESLLTNLAIDTSEK